jgi:hypothetical protein
MLFEPASQVLGQVLVAGGLGIPQRFSTPTQGCGRLLPLRSLSK